MLIGFIRADEDVCKYSKNGAKLAIIRAYRNPIIKEKARYEIVGRQTYPKDWASRGQELPIPGLFVQRVNHLAIYILI